MPNHDPSHLVELLGVPFSDEQLAAITAPMAPGVIIAGAGSGKTTAMAARVVWLVLTGAVAPDEVLGLTFTRKATAQLVGKVRAALRQLDIKDEFGEPHGGEPEISTYHSFAGQVVEEFGLRIGLEPQADIIADPRRHQLALRVLRNTSLSLTAGGAKTSALVSGILDLDDALAEYAIDPQQLIDEDDRFISSIMAYGAPIKDAQAMVDAAARRQLLARLVVEFREAKRAADVRDFADQTRLSELISREVPMASETLRERFKLVLLDEYQDTSIAQRRLMQQLFGGGHAVTAVGDPCQAIYGWRGASVANIDEFPQHFAHEGLPAAISTLRTNRRSGSRILGATNDLASELRTVHKAVGELVPGNASRGEGHLECALLPTYADEIDWLADALSSAHAAGRPWDEMAVLTRAGDPLNDIQKVLQSRGIPSQIVGTTSLLRLPEIVEVISILEVLHDPTANPAMVHLLTGPRWRIGPRDLAILGRHAAQMVKPLRSGSAQATIEDLLAEAVEGIDTVDVVSLSDAVLAFNDSAAPDLGLSAEAATRLRRLAGELRHLRGHLGESVPDIISRILSVTGLDVELAAVAGDSGASRRTAVHALMDLAADFRDLQGDASLGAYLRRIHDAQRFDAKIDVELPSVKGAIALMTIHKSKGLEFPLVALPMLVKDVFPGSKTPDKPLTIATAMPMRLRGTSVPSDLEFPTGKPTGKMIEAWNEAWKQAHLIEETRLGYVAVTRAESHLIASGHWWGPTQKETRGPSEFLSVIKDHCLPKDISEWADEPAEGAANPRLDPEFRMREWPVVPDAEARAARQWAADGVRNRLESGNVHVSPSADPITAVWDRDLALLLAEARANQSRKREVHLPIALTASDLIRVNQDPQAFAARLVRPMPQAPAPAARRGTALHSWIERRYGQQVLLTPDELPGAADSDITTPEELTALQAKFLALPYADRKPVAVEAPFALVLGPVVVRGRIDAVFQDEHGYEVVDWKTGASSDVVQLAIYRLAWAAIMGIDENQVRGTFVHIKSGIINTPARLPSREEVEAIVTAQP